LIVHITKYILIHGVKFSLHIITILSLVTFHLFSAAQENPVIQRARSQSKDSNSSKNTDVDTFIDTSSTDFRSATPPASYMKTKESNPYLLRTVNVPNMMRVVGPMNQNHNEVEFPFDEIIRVRIDQNRDRRGLDKCTITCNVTVCLAFIGCITGIAIKKIVQSDLFKTE
jgi:hypothetical protein